MPGIPSNDARRSRPLSPFALRRLSMALTLLGVLGFPARALAGDTALAESLFRQGRALLEQNNYAAACPKLAESFNQDPATGTLLALAVCQEQNGQTASAWASYAEVVSRSKREARADREQAARDHMRALEPKLSHLTVELDPKTAALAGLVVKRDGNVIGRAAWGDSTPVDPGDHVVEATADGKRAWATSVKVAADPVTVKVPPLDDAPVAATAGAVEQPAPGESTGQPDEGTKPKGSTLRYVGLAVGGAGIVSLGIAGFFGLRATNADGDSKADGNCDANDFCNAAGRAKRDEAVSAATNATIFLIAGTALTATGVTLFIVGRPSKDASPAVGATPVVGPGQAAMVLRGRF